MNKASGGDGIPAELFQILKDDAVKVLCSIYQQIWKTQQWSQDWKCQFSFQSQRRAIPKNVQMNAFSNAFSFQMLARLCSESIKVGFSSIPVFKKFQMSKLDLEKAEELENKLPTSVG